MIGYKLGEIELKFAQLIWENQPLSSGELVKLAEKALDWKKSTTYTVLRKLCAKGLFQNENGAVITLVSEETYMAKQSHRFVEESFSGSLPQFLTAFAKEKRLSNQEIQSIQAMIDQYREG